MDELKVIHEGSSKDFTGIIDVSVIVINNSKKYRYTYPMGSSYKENEFLKYIKRKNYKGALDYLNKNRIK